MELHPKVKKFLSDIGKKGGSQKTEKKKKASRENAKKGGWPKGRKRKTCIVP